MRAKEYLSTIERMELDIRAKRERLREVENRCKNVGAIRYDKDKVQSSVKNRHEEMMARYLDMQMELEEEILALERKKNEIVAQLERMSNPIFKVMLMMKHCEGKNWEQIAEELHFSYGYVRNMSKKAYEAFENEDLN